MIRLLDGPAMLGAISLALRAAPPFLRVVRSKRKQGEEAWDGLDQPGDTPKPTEEVYVYRRVELGRRMHIKFSGSAKRASGFYANAAYRYVADQPEDATVRDEAKWREWCQNQEPAKGNQS